MAEMNELSNLHSITWSWSTDIQIRFRIIKPQTHSSKCSRNSDNKKSERKKNEQKVIQPKTTQKTNEIKE